MKKLIVIFTAFVLLIGFSIFEMLYTKQVYGEITAEVTAIYESVPQRESAADTPQNRERLLKAETAWKRGRPFVLCVTHHNLARTMDERLATLRAWLEMGNAEETRVAAAITIELTHDLCDEAFVTLSNLF